MSNIYIDFYFFFLSEPIIIKYSIVVNVINMKKLNRPNTRKDEDGLCGETVVTVE